MKDKALAWGFVYLKAKLNCFFVFPAFISLSLSLFVSFFLFVGLCVFVGLLGRLLLACLVVCLAGLFGLCVCSFIRSFVWKFVDVPICLLANLPLNIWFCVSVFL